MQRRYRALSQTRLKDGVEYHLPDPHSTHCLTLESPAVDVMTDLFRVPAATVSADTPVEDVQRLMIQRGVRSLLVVDAHRHLIGIITTTDLLGEKPMQAVRERGIAHRDVLVRDIMTPRDRLETLDMREVQSAEIGHIVSTMTAAGRQHALVADVDQEGRSFIRGLFSTSHIARELGISIQTPEVARTFAEIEAAIAR